MPDFCAQCGSSLTEGGKFCEQCGAPIGEQVVLSTHSRRVDNPQNDSRGKTAQQAPVSPGQIATVILIILLAIGIYWGVNQSSPSNGFLQMFRLNSSDLTRQQASALFNAEDSFREGDIVHGFLTYQGIDEGLKRNLFERTLYGLRLTDTGRHLFPGDEYIKGGSVPFHIRFYGANVTGITSESENKRRVEFTFRGKELGEIGEFVLDSDYACTGMGSFRLYDDGWRIQNIQKSCQVIPHADAMAELKREATMRQEAEQQEAREQAEIIEKSKHPSRTLKTFDQELSGCVAGHERVRNAIIVTDANLEYIFSGCQRFRKEIWFGDIQQFQSHEAGFTKGSHQYTRPGIRIHHPGVAQVTFPGTEVRDAFLQQLESALNFWRKQFRQVLVPPDYSQRAHSQDIPMR